ncbi:MAG: hypothetical protein EOR11_20075 [Mesorhizobium sp.]|uniref:hypothetical protein n=1 Tax=Mesorhizobium sp. TaxID=1871066 RepID=UPI000FE7F371|nr:hypothetical protein [Mesorhizobium sp.]RWP84760.1 MAG: hypothetical protein EOR11_20075 [Mesorhizobium sp.]
MSRAIGNQAEVGVVAKTISAATRTLLVADNNSRVGLTVRNNSTAVLTIFLGLAAGTEEGTVTIAPTATGVDSTWVCPVNYTGPVSGQWASANGFAYTTEFI